MKKLISGLVLFLIAVSCSIKEDRTGCPCQLTIVLENPLDLSSGLETTIISDGLTTGETIKGRYGKEEFSYGIFRTVTKDSIRVSAVSGRNLEEVGSIVGVREGREIDSLYADAEIVDCHKESAICKMHMHKQFCTLTVIVNESSWGQPSGITVSGGSNGLDITTLQPVTGSYKAKMRAIEEKTYEIRIPRQTDGKLNVVLNFDDGRSVSLSLGDYLASHGYSWSKADLDDITVVVDLTSSTLTISIAGWDIKTFNEIII